MAETSTMRHASVLFLCLALSGCCWWAKDAPLPEPATNNGLASAESRLDHLTDKRDSRVASAVATAKDISTEDAVKAELDVAQAMLPTPTAADLAFAKARAAKGDVKTYAEQVAVSRALAASIIEANKKYEAEKARKQAEYESRLKEREMALAAEQEARQADKWTYAGIGLVTIGLLVAFLTPLKLAGVGIFLSGIVVGAFPILSKSEHFLPVLGIIVVSVGAGIAIPYHRRKAPAADAQNHPQDPKDSAP